jgi:hypothetical protein
MEDAALEPAPIWCGEPGRCVARGEGVMLFRRTFAMPNSDTFCVKPIAQFVQSYLRLSRGESCDPFARNSKFATWTNDLNPQTTAEYHMDAVAFLEMLLERGVKCDLAILDPPYSPRQISECYKAVGLACTMKDTQNAALYKRVRDALLPVLTDDAIVLSFGWNSTGMGPLFEPMELLLVCHGGAHNDTICIAEKRKPDLLKTS